MKDKKEKNKAKTAIYLNNPELRAKVDKIQADTGLSITQMIIRALDEKYSV